MTEELQTAPWAQEITGLWLSGQIDRCHELLLQHLGIRLPFGVNESASSSASTKERSGNAILVPGASIASSSSQCDPNAAELVFTTPHDSLSSLILEQDWATVHNALLAHFLANGESLPWKWSDLLQMRMSVPVETLFAASHRGSSNSVAASSSHSKPSALCQLAHFKPSPGSKLDPYSYAADSIEASLAALGPLQPLAWYNLVVLQIARNQYRLALKTCDALLDHLFPALVEASHPLAIKIGLLFLYLTIKLNYSTHPKHFTILTELEKVITSRLASTQGQENLICLEQNVWFHIMRAQHSLIHLRMKSSKREGSSMMAAYSKWSAERQEQLYKGVKPATSLNGAGPETVSNNTPPLPSVGDPVSCAMQFVKCRLLDLRSNQEKADSELQDPSILQIAAAPFYNNLGVLAFHRRKFAVASLYFLKASQENQKMRQAISMQVPNDTRRHVPESIVDISVDVTYNMGLQMIMLGQFDGALRCFQEVSQKTLPGTLNSSQAMTYLRLAEAQLAVYCAKLAKLAAAAPPRSPVATFNQTPVPSPHATLRSTSPTSTTSSNSSSSSSSSTNSGQAQPKLVSEVFRDGGFLRLARVRSAELDSLLENASQAASMALMLFERFGRSGAPAPSTRSIGTPKDSSTHFALADRMLMTSRDYLLRVYTHVLLAWTALESNNTVKALEYASLAISAHSELESNTAMASANSQQLSASEKSELDHYYFLAHLYQAEAELKLGNIENALVGLSNAPVHLAKYPLLPATHPYAHRSNKVVNGLATNASAPQNVDSASPPMPHTIIHSPQVSAKAALLCNMAAVYIVKKDVLQAQKLLSQALTQAPHLLPAVALQIYLELSVGNIELAVRLMCDFRVPDLLCIR